jgi:rhamnosyl/mannosyltransferase
VEAFNVERPEEARAIQTKYGSRLIVAVGRLVPYKGFEFLLQAMKHVNADLLLIGSGPEREQLQKMTERFGISGKAHLLGQVEDLAPYYKASRLMVLPSITRAEAFGMVQVEAMAAGLPVVNTSLNSGVAEVSLHGVTGITVPPKDANALAEAINLLLSNEEMRMKYGQAAKIRAQEEFSVRRMAETTLELYREVLEGERKQCQQKANLG